MPNSITYESVMDAAESLVTAANKVADIMERLAEAQDTQVKAKLGVLPDGTPIEDMLVELSEAKQELAAVRSLLRDISHTAHGCNSMGAYTAIKTIRQMLSGGA